MVVTRRVAVAVWLLVSAAACRQLLGLDGPNSGGDAGSGSEVSVPHDGAGSNGSGSDGSGSSSACDPTACAAAAGTCMAGVCYIDPLGSSAFCPAGMPCKIHCGSCGPVLDCSKATSCTIDCEWTSSCQNKDIRCGPSFTLYCRGDSTCTSSTLSQISTSCAVNCCGQGSCNAMHAGNCSIHVPGTCP